MHEAWVNLLVAVARLLAALVGVVLTGAGVVLAVELVVHAPPTWSGLLRVAGLTGAGWLLVAVLERTE